MQGRNVWDFGGWNNGPPSHERITRMSHKRAFPKQPGYIRLRVDKWNVPLVGVGVQTKRQGGGDSLSILAAWGQGLERV